MTRNLTLLLTAAIVSVGTAVPLAAHAATASVPVRVAKCEPRAHPFDPASGYSTAYYRTAGPYSWYDVYGHPFQQPHVTRATPILAIDYTNVTSKPIKQIDFGLVSGGKLVTEVRDVGTFAPGSEIKHEFGITEEALASGASQCVPLRSTFADGTTWKNPELPKPTAKTYASPSPP